jgi:mono/diheme cytochrome c family protein
MKKIFILALTGLSFSVLADESKIQLKEGPGKDLVTAQCGICHSNDMIQINSPFLDKKGWEGEVNKMIKVMGAPLPAEDVPKVVEYLTRYYGK